MTRLTSFDGTRLVMRTYGPREAPLVVLVHGLGLSADSWGAVPEQLADRHRVVAYDLRNHGRSDDAGPAGHRLDAHRRDLGAVLTAVVADGDQALVVGHSLGGTVILSCAASRNDRIAGVVLVGYGGGSVIVPRFPTAGMTSCLRPARRVTLGALGRAGRGIRSLEPAASRLVGRSAFAESERPGLVERVRQSLLRSRPVELALTTLASVTDGGVRLARRVAPPTLVLHGTADPELPQRRIERLRDALPDARLVQVPGAGSMLPLTHGDLVAEEIARWVRLLGLPPSGQPAVRGGAPSAVTLPARGR